MAEAMFKKMLTNEGLSDNYSVSSAATENDEAGSRPHPGAQKTMDAHHLDYRGKRSHPITATDIQNADYIITMDDYNISDLKEMIPQDQWDKLHLCMDIVPGKKGVNIVDPWYTHRFEDTYQMLDQALPLWLKYMQDHHNSKREGSASFDSE
ncbi:phosphotyrosine protein phosphatase [Fructilactobacillus fructivorans]|nr:phosphotyrosine protein phosphatase [Fructilactobacillus fructivorans]KRN12477.1 phosphotyrosine protein phosphatase [Fructilactobacillus fructivorans]